MKKSTFLHIATLGLLVSCSDGETGSLYSTKPITQVKKCADTSQGFSLADEVAYWPNIREFIDTNCTNCHGDNNVQQLDFRGYAVAKQTLDAKGNLDFNRIVEQVNAGHKGTYSPTVKESFALWQTSSFIEFLPGKTIDDYVNSNNDQNNESDDLPDTVKDILADFEKDSDENQENTTGDNSNFGSSNQQGSNCR